MATLEELQSFVGKEVRVLFTVPDSKETVEQIGEIKVATVAGVGWTQKGKAGAELKQPDDFYEVDLAPVKAKSVSQKKLKPIPDGQVRQHLADRHGTSLKWCKEATEEDAKKYHEGLDHSDCGHVHVAEEAKPDERAEALADPGVVQAATA